MDLQIRTFALWIVALLAVIAAPSVPANAADFEFFGRSGNGIEVDFGALPGVSSGASFSNLTLGGFTGHTVLDSDQLGQGSFSSEGRLWVFADPSRNTAALGDLAPDERGFQGRLEGSVSIDGQPKTFAVTVRPGYTGAGEGAVLQGLEAIGRRNNKLHVAQQQQRLRYLGFVSEGGGQLVVDGLFGNNTDTALRTFQGAFVGGVNTTQNSVDGIVGPNTAGWLNAVNAPRWNELIDPNPQRPAGSFSVANIRGDFDILPGRDPGTGARTGFTPQPERFGTDWSIDFWFAGSAAAHANTGIPQLMNAMSTDDGYGSAFAHNTHRVGLDIDMHVAGATQNFGNGSINSAEQDLIDIAVAYIDAGNAGGPHRGSMARIIFSNADVIDGINAARPSVPTFLDPSSVHLNHLHLDIAPPAQVAGTADLAGDFDLNGVVDGLDFLLWQNGKNPHSLNGGSLADWQSNYGGAAAAAIASVVPEPTSLVLLIGGVGVGLLGRKRL